MRNLFFSGHNAGVLLLLRTFKSFTFIRHNNLMNYNKNFVQIPLYKLVQKIEYKAKLEGIKVEKISEKYTSGVSALDREEIIKENYNKKRRISRGIFVTNRGIK